MLFENLIWGFCEGELTRDRRAQSIIVSQLIDVSHEPISRNLP